MNEKAYLKIQIIAEDRSERTVRGKIFDGQAFTLKVRLGDVKVIDESKEDGNQVGWLEVEYLGSSNGRAAITLPRSTLDLGKYVTVNVSRIKMKLT